MFAQLSMHVLKVCVPLRSDDMQNYAAPDVRMCIILHAFKLWLRPH